MSHFAHVLSGRVVDVIVAEQDFINILPDPENWIQTSLNTYGGVHYAPNVRPLSADGGVALHYNYARIGDCWDSVGFYTDVSPYPSWIFSKNNYLWEAPVPYPTDKGRYRWDESTTNWLPITAIYVPPLSTTP